MDRTKSNFWICRPATWTMLAATSRREARDMELSRLNVVASAQQDEAARQRRDFCAESLLKLDQHRVQSGELEPRADPALAEFGIHQDDAPRTIAIDLFDHMRQSIVLKDQQAVAPSGRHFEVHRDRRTQIVRGEGNLLPRPNGGRLSLVTDVNETVRHVTRTSGPSQRTVN